MRPNRVAVWFLAAKTCVAAGLLASLTMPFATCHSNGRMHDLSGEVIDLPSFVSAFLVFAWPLPLIVFQVIALAFGRRYRTVVGIECAGALYSWWQLQMQVVMLAIFTLGSTAAGPGYLLANDCDEGYFALAALELLTSRYSAVISRPPSSST